MVTVDLKNLVGRLNDTCRRTLEAAAGLCLSRTNYNVEVEHWLLKIVEAGQNDADAIFHHYGVDTARLGRDLVKAIDRFKTGNARPPALSPDLVELTRGAWMAASVDFGAWRVRTGHLICALLGDEALGRMAEDISEEFKKIPIESLRRELGGVTAVTSEAEEALAGGGAEPAAGPGAAPRPGGPSRTPGLDQYTNDLTARAKAGKIDPVLGRDAEIRQIIDILMRRRQNNPILTGEAGVGKTAVVEGFALRVAAGDIPAPLRNVSLRSLDLGLLQAGAGMKGEFENRLKSVIEEVKASPRPIIIFIDEAHTLIGAGGAAGQGDAANLLKPALARGEMRTIAATTWAEYKKYFEKDAAMARRFQVVRVEEPGEEAAVVMMRGIVDTLEKHHKVTILDEAVVDSVKLSHRYISGRQLPDKSVSLLDTACARVAVGQSALPPALEDCQRSIEQLATAIEILEREQSTGADHKEKLAELQSSKAAAEKEKAALEARWQKEKDLVVRILKGRKALQPQAARTQAPAAAAAPAPSTPAAPAPAPSDGPVSEEERARLRAELDALTAELKALQEDKPLLQVCVDSQAIAQVVSGWTGIPVGRMVTDEIRGILNLQGRLAERIIGQDHALAAIAQAIRTSRAKMSDPRKPIGVFLFVGTSGVGKTETAIALTELMYGSEQNMTTINMSEFKEEHKVSLLMGSPPGYVGYGEGGVLTEAVRRKPYSVLLLDEMEKAHPGVQDIFYQVFDKGSLRDGEGRDINFKNTVIIMTSNAATDLITKLCADPETRPNPDGLQESIYPELLKTFKPAFLGRVAIVPFYPLTDDVMRLIIKLQLGRVSRRVRESYRAACEFSPDIISHIADRCKEVSTGARNIDHILTRTLLPELSAEFLSRMADAKPIRSVKVNVQEGKFRYEIT